MRSGTFLKSIFAFCFFLLCLHAKASNGWRTVYLDIDVSIELPWSADREESTDGVTYKQYYGSSLLMVSRSEAKFEPPADKDALLTLYSNMVQTAVGATQGQLMDSSVIVMKGILAEKAHIALRKPPHDSAFVAEVIYIYGNKHVYCFQYLHPADETTPPPDVSRALNSITIGKYFTPDQQFLKKRHSDTFDWYFRLGFNLTILVASILLGYYAIRKMNNRNKLGGKL